MRDDEVTAVRLRESLHKSMATSFDLATQLVRTHMDAGRQQREIADNGMPTDWPADTTRFYAEAAQGRLRIQERSAAKFWPNRPGTILYLLHAALPDTSVGYAIRSHGLLKGLNAAGWNAIGVIRPDSPSNESSSSIQPSGIISPDEVSIDSVRYLRLPPSRHRPGSNLGDYLDNYASDVADLAREQNAQVIHAASNAINGWAGVRAASQIGIPSVYEVRGLWLLTRASRDPGFENTDYFRAALAMEIEAAEEADLAFAISKPLIGILERCGVTPGKVQLLPNGVDPTEFTPQSRDLLLEATHNLVGKIVIGYVGSILEYEGLELLIRAASYMHHLRHLTHFLIVGDGDSFAELSQMVVNLGLDDFVTLTGRVPHEDVRRYYSLINIAPFPRLPYPVTDVVSPLKPFEAFALEKAVVLSDCQVLKQIVEDGAPGIIFPAGDPHELADVLTRLVLDSQTRETVGRQGRQWVVEHRSWRMLSERLGDSLLARSEGGESLPNLSAIVRPSAALSTAPPITSDITFALAKSATTTNMTSDAVSEIGQHDTDSAISSTDVDAWLSHRADAINVEALIYADINLNLIDGSSIWLVSASRALASLHPTVLVSPVNLADSELAREVRCIPNLLVLEPRNLGNSARRLKPSLAFQVSGMLDQRLPSLRSVLVRGFGAAEAFHATRQFQGRLNVYLTDFYQVNEGQRLYSANTEQLLSMFAAKGSRFLCQTNQIDAEIRRLSSEPVKSTLWPPSLPESLPPLRARKNRNAVTSIGYAGKLDERWGVIEFAEAVVRLHEADFPIRPIVFAGKASSNFEKAFEARLGMTLREFVNRMHGEIQSNVAREVVLRRMEEVDFAWCWRPSTLEDGTLEVSTKVIEMAAIGVPCLAQPTVANIDVLGEQYPFYISDASEVDKVLGSSQEPLGPHPEEVRTRYSWKNNANQYRQDAERNRAGWTGKVVFAGHDMKFVEAFVSHLKSNGGEAAQDAWKWGGPVDESRSEQLGQWADVVFCEWGLANAVWYSRQPNRRGPLVVRIHLQEVSEAAHHMVKQIDADRVDRFIFVSEKVMHQAQEMYGWDGSKCVHIPNYVLEDEYTLRPREVRNRVTLGMVGITPARKRLDRAIDLLQHLLERGVDADLRIKGKRPEDYAWMRRPDRRQELKYYEALYERIELNPLLSQLVIFDPWGNDMLAWYRDVDIILSPSDFESFHYGLADGVLTGAYPIVWNWTGASETYKPSWIIGNLEEASSRIEEWQARTLSEREIMLASNRQLLVDQYGSSRIFRRLSQTVIEAIGRK